MEAAIREYDARLDDKKRFTVRGAAYEHYHVTEYEDGSIVLQPRVLVHPSVLKRMEEDFANFERGVVSEPVNDEMRRLAQEWGIE